MGIKIALAGLLVAGLLFLLWRFLLRKCFHSSAVRLLVVVLATILSWGLLYLVSVWIVITAVSYYPHRHFDRESWWSDIPKRYEMADHLIDSRFLIGKTKDEVLELLGPRKSETDDKDVWHYYLGHKPGLFNIDPDILEITFQSGRVVSVRQHET